MQSRARGAVQRSRRRTKAGAAAMQAVGKGNGSSVKQSSGSGAIDGLQRARAAAFRTIVLGRRRSLIAASGAEQGVESASELATHGAIDEEVDGVGEQHADVQDQRH